MIKKNEKVRVLWNDAVIYNIHSDIPTKLSKMQTIGYIVKETKDYLILENPKTTNLEKKIKHPKNGNPTFYFIPKGMVSKLELL